jgi:hypothetical protein
MNSSDALRIGRYAALVIFAASLIFVAYALADTVADSDGDGIGDEVDRCVVKQGVEQHYGCPSKVRVESKVTRPIQSRTVRIRGWKPWATPTLAQVYLIAEHEAKLWGVNIIGRILCESGGSWSASNGQYLGLLQYGPIWYSMWPGTPRRVKFTQVKKPKRPVVRHTLWSDGKWTHTTIGKRRVTRKVIRIGMLPRNPSQLHGWAAIRNGTRAAAGVGPSTSWACGY